MTVTPIFCDNYWVSACCMDQECALCGRPASAKVVEHIKLCEAYNGRRALSAYLCENHFLQMMGPTAVMAVEQYRSGLTCQAELLAESATS